MALPYDYVKAWRARPENKGKRAEEARRWRERHPGTAKAIQDRYREKNIEHIRELDRVNTQRRRKADPEAQAERQRRFKERKEEKRVAEAGRPRSDVCELCGTPGKTVWDHDHRTGAFRGWICDPCNRVLGVIKDNPELLRSMADYIERGGYSPPSAG